MSDIKEYKFPSLEAERASRALVIWDMARRQQYEAEQRKAAAKASKKDKKKKSKSV